MMAAELVDLVDVVRFKSSLMLWIFFHRAAQTVLDAPQVVLDAAQTFLVGGQAFLDARQTLHRPTEARLHADENVSGSRQTSAVAIKPSVVRGRL